MEFRVLGPLEVRQAGGAIELRGSKRRAVLALLLLHANEVIRADRLIDHLWGEDPPANATAALRNHISRLRKDLGGDVLATMPRGYVLRTDPETIDLRRFERLVAEAKPLAAHERAALLAEAQALWRGPALADLAHEPAFAAEIPRLEELRLAAVEQRIDADLELGRHEALIPELEALVGEQPLREHLRGQLILALYRCGRQAEALETYRETRRVLVEELGIDPNAELRELERAILRQDPSLAVAPLPRDTSEPREPNSRWRWPRSPLAAALGLLILGGAGAATGVVATRGGASPPRRVAHAPLTEAPRATTESRAKGRTHVETRVQRATKPGVRRTRPSERAAKPARRAAHSGKRQSPVAATSSKLAKTPTSTQQATTSPATARWMTITDDFSDRSVDRTIWHVITTGTEVGVEQFDGRLEISIGPEAVAGGTYNVIDGHYGTQCRLPGDFDARVDFTLLEWPESNGVFAGLNAFFADTAVGRQSSINWGEQYAAWVIPNNGGIPGAIDTSGSIRIARTGSRMSTYVMHKGAWLRVASGRNTGVAVVGLQAMSKDEDFGHKAVRVAFDNFRLKAKDPTCPYQ